MSWLLGPGSAAQAVSIDLVSVGEPGNSGDPVVVSGGTNDGTSGYGAVDHAYRIGRHEVSNAQYADFLNAVAASDPAGLYDALMAGRIDRTGSDGSYLYAAPTANATLAVVFVSFWDALRFANWLHNGQPSGAQSSATTEAGAYTLLGANPVGVTRNPGAIFFLPSEDQWYKAAYYAGSGSYLANPFADGQAPLCEAPAGTTSHSANCAGAVGGPGAVGAYPGSPGPYGTFDQGGNVWEWNEAIIGPQSRGVRGGGYDSPAAQLGSAFRNAAFADNQDGLIGFRIAALVPEAGSALLLASGFLALAQARRRPRRR